MSNTQTLGETRRKRTRRLSSPSLVHRPSIGLWFPARNNDGASQHGLQQWKLPPQPQIQYTMTIKRSSGVMEGWKRGSSELSLLRRPKSWSGFENWTQFYVCGVLLPSDLCNDLWNELIIVCRKWSMVIYEFESGFCGRFIGVVIAFSHWNQYFYFILFSLFWILEVHIHTPNFSSAHNVQGRNLPSQRELG